MWLLENDTLVGRGRMTMAYAALALTYQVHPQRYFSPSRGIAVIPIAERKSAIEGSKKLFVCPNCERRRERIVYKSGWACYACHELSYRSRLVDITTRRVERAAVLRDLIGKGRPKGMHRSTYSAFLSESKALTSDLRNRMVGGPSAAHSSIVRTLWCEPGDLTYQRYFYPEDPL